MKDVGNNRINQTERDEDNPYDDLPGLVYVAGTESTRPLRHWRGDFPAAEKLLREEAGRNAQPLWEKQIYSGDRAMVQRETEAAAAEGRSYRLIYRLKNDGGEPLWVLDRGRLRADGQLVGFVTDHTERMTELTNKERQRAILEERNRVARDLHDTIAQALYSISLFAEAGRNLIKQEKANFAQACFDQIMEASHQSQRDIRLLVHNLRPSRVAEVGLVEAIRRRLAAVEGRAGLEHEINIEPLPNLTPEIEDALYVIIHESLTNSLKHARADHVSVHMRHDPDLHMVFAEVQDNGRGFSPKENGDGGGLGLISIKERAALLGGLVEFDSKPNIGTTVKIQIPLN